MSPSNPQKLASSSSGLFGNDDSQFLEALREVNIPSEIVSQPGLKEPSSSSELFGNEDSAYLDALSRITLPGDVDQSQCEASIPIHHIPEHTTQDSGPRKRKRSVTPEGPRNSVTHDTQAKPLYTDSDVYGPSKFEGFGEYMYRKRAKLSIQNSEIEGSGNGKKSTLFQGLSLYVRRFVVPVLQLSDFQSDQWKNQPFCSSITQAHYTTWRYFSPLPRPKKDGVCRIIYLTAQSHITTGPILLHQTLHHPKYWSSRV